MEELIKIKQMKNELFKKKKELIKRELISILFDYHLTKH